MIPIKHKSRFGPHPLVNVKISKSESQIVTYENCQFVLDLVLVADFISYISTGGCAAARHSSKDCSSSTKRGYSHR